MMKNCVRPLLDPKGRFSIPIGRFSEPKGRFGNSGRWFGAICDIVTL